MITKLWTPEDPRRTTKSSCGSNESVETVESAESIDIEKPSSPFGGSSADWLAECCTALQWDSSP